MIGSVAAERPQTEQVSSRVVYENPWIRLREDEVRFINGEQSIYGIVEKPDYVVVIPWQDGRLGVVTQYRYPIDAWKTEFPQGGIDSTDSSTSPAEAAVRELREETGLIAGELTNLGMLHEGYGFMSQRYHVFAATVVGTTGATPEPSEGEMTFAWITPAEFWDRVDSGDISDGATLASIALFTRWLKT